MMTILHCSETRLSHIDWDSVITSDDANSCFNQFADNFRYAYNECFPERVKCIKARNNIYKPWIPSAITKSINRKEALYKNWTKKRTNESLIKYKNYNS